MPSADLAADLEAARKLIERPEAWTQGRTARDANDRPTLADGTDATKWSVYGALLKVNRGSAFERWLELHMNGHGSDWEDDPARTHQDILALFDRAIAAAKELP